MTKKTKALIALYHKLQTQTDLLDIFLYLVDWKHNIDNQHSITNLKWSVYESGIPYSLNKEPYISHLKDGGKDLFSYFNNEEIFSIRHVIDFIKDNHVSYIHHIVLSTYPCLIGAPHKEINFQECASKYHSIISQKKPI